MATKFRHKIQHVVLMDAKAESPWARFVDHVFETDDKKIIERLASVPDVTKLPDEPAAEADDQGSK